MKKFRWQLLILFLTGLLVGVLLILEKRGGFGRVGDLQPVQGGVYTEALVGNLSRLNPLLDSANQVDQDIDRLIFSGLVRFDSRGMPEPDLAESVRISQDGILYNITLKEKLTWHDGQPLTTADVNFTINLMKAGEGYVAADLVALWNEIKVVVIDDLNMQLILPEAYAPFQDYLAFGVLPNHLLGSLSVQEIADSEFNLNPVGSGPFKFSTLIVEDGQIAGLSLVAFENYVHSAPFLEEIVFRYYPDAQSAYQAYLDKYVQGISEIPYSLLPTAIQNEDLSIYTGRLPQLSMVMFNLNDQGVPFFQDADIRKALLLALNRQKMINQIFNGQAIVASGVIFPGNWAYSDAVAPLDYDIEQAKMLIKEAGYVVTGEENPVRKKEDIEFKFVLSYPDDELHRVVAESIQADWKKLDIEVVLEPIPADLYLSDKLTPRAFQAALVDLDLSGTPDPDPYPFWDSGQATTGQNYSQWNDRIASDTIEQARVTTNFNERIRLYHNFQEIFARELPSLPLYYPVYNYGVDNTINGVSFGPLMDVSDRFSTVNLWNMIERRTQVTATPAEK